MLILVHILFIVTYLLIMLVSYVITYLCKVRFLKNKFFVSKQETMASMDNINDQNNNNDNNANNGNIVGGMPYHNSIRCLTRIGIPQRNVHRT